jgi:DNA mismatch repair protein MutL
VGRIRILPDAIANQIAAGEVVERPASVVKELLENSLDAGAAEIRVDAEAGGRRLIRVADDGCGMLRDDALLAFERHATSKLREARDLFAIATLGFRGEALPSIASVSRLELETRSAEETTGARIEIAGAKLLKCEAFARPPGTTVTVRDLFYNVPARRKFLRSEPTELAHLASLVTHYSLAHPEKSFELNHEGHRLLSVTPVATLRERVFQVFGSEVLEDLVAIPDREHEGFRLTGFVSRPRVQKQNRNSIYLFVNRRLIRDRLLLHALTAAYHNLIPQQTYPFALLFLDCPAEEVDVNVHPAKTEIRFQRGSFVHDFVRDAARETLVESRPVSSIPLPAAAQPAAALPLSEFSLRIESPAAPLPQQARLVIPEAVDRELPVMTMPPLAAPPAAGELAPELTGAPESLADLRPIGQLKNSFIVATGRDALWVIDQHIAHERIWFEKVLRSMASGAPDKQRLLAPIVLPLTVGQEIEYPRVAQELERAGFETAPFGQRTIAIQAAPAGLTAAQIETIVTEILEVAQKELRRATVEDVRRQVAASVACHASIKVNTPLDPPRMEWLLAELSKCEYPDSCPHGRPIAIRYPLRDILKAFHRV